MFDKLYATFADRVPISLMKNYNHWLRELVKGEQNVFLEAW
jgi:hypothetical protein